MGFEHTKDFGFKETASPERQEYGFRDLESERPSSGELPSLRSNQGVKLESVERKSYDSERESIELPHIVNKQDVEEKYLSSYEERISHTPSEKLGKWNGERGESEIKPYDKTVKDLLATYGKEGITYKDGLPDFSELSVGTVKIDNMTENRAENFKQCDEKCAEQWNKEGKDGKTDWTARDVKAWRQENGYSWHEKNDMKTCELIPAKIHSYFTHLGGVSECKKRDANESGGNDFDE